MSTASWTSREAAIVAPPRRRDLVVHEHDGELIVSLPVEGGTFQLNRTAAAVWMQCDGRRTMRAIAGELAGAHEDAAFDDVLNDVEELVVWFAESGLLRA